MCWQGAIPPPHTDQRVLVAKRLQELEGYRPGHEWVSGQAGVEETCWACDQKTLWAMTMNKRLSGMAYMAPLCRGCYDDFCTMYLEEMVAWELMR